MRAIVRQAWVVGLMLGSGMPALAAGTENAPTEKSAPDADPFNGHEWALTPYLQGTAPQIRDKLNGETERLIAKIRETQQAIRQGNNDARNDEKAALEKMKNGADYKQTLADKARAETDLEAARKGGSAEDRLNASSRFNRARLALEQMEHDAVAGSKALSQDRHQIFDAEKDLKRYNEALEKAIAWREELLDATRNGFMLKGPVAEGSKGTLPRVTVENVVDEEQVLVGFDLITFDREHPGREKEGIKSFPATKSRVHVLATGIETKGMKVGDKLSLDRVFIIDQTKPGEKDSVVYVAKPVPSDADKLFEMIVPLREPLPGKAPPGAKK